MTGQGRRDSVADAETLRLFLVDGRHFCGLSFRDIGPLTPFALNTNPAHAVRRAIWAGHYNVACRRTVRLVRAARNAIPGLSE